MGERSAVRPKSGESVCQSDPGLRRPTPPSTAGRKPAARPPFQVQPPTRAEDNGQSREAGLAQSKIGRGAGQSPAVLSQREALRSFTEQSSSHASALGSLDESQIASLLEFFTILDRWDREAHGNGTM
jgi:hypothetical protein